MPHVAQYMSIHVHCPGGPTFFIEKNVFFGTPHCPGIGNLYILADMTCGSIHPLSSQCEDKNRDKDKNGVKDKHKEKDKVS